MPDHEKEKLLREVEKGLMHSREIIGQIDKVLAQRSRLLLAAKSQWRLSGGFGNANLAPPPASPLVRSDF